jgi:hypothetical protein
LFRFLATPGIEVTNLLFTGDSVIWVMWKYVEEEENIHILRHTNGTRLKLYSYLDALKEMTIYCNAASVFYI